jgi:hypothetical protein
MSHPEVRIARLPSPGLVPHSQCSYREIPKFLQNFRSKNYTLKENFCLIFLVNICHCNIKVWHSKVKTVTLLHIIVCLSQEKIPKTNVRNTSELCE